MPLVEPSYHYENESALLEALQQGEAAAYHSINKKYAHQLLSYGIGLGFNREVVKDAIQDVLYNFYSCTMKLKDVKSIKSYLFKSLKNRLLNIRRKEVDTVDLHHRELEFSIKVTVLEELISEEERQNIQSEIEKYLNCLTSRQREAIYLRFIQELEYDEIAALLKMSVHGTRKLISRAISRIREQNLNPLSLIILLQVLSPIE